MKRVVICCDGTWKTSTDANVSNIEKIARAIRTTTEDGTVQLVHYCSGVGTGATLTDRIIGGAFGAGLDQNIIDAYRFITLNYEVGDEIYVFGFSRGAYTARSLVGMIAKVGLLTADGLACPPRPDVNLLDVAFDRYRRASRKHQPLGGTDRYQDIDLSDYVYAKTPIAFVGVFDTVGALGAPGITRRNYRFLDVNLSDSVEVARQALAIDERRLTFAPCVWTRGTNDRTDLEQVWFEGVHSDIGGGFGRTEPADLTLAWMVTEAGRRGLEFHPDRLPMGRPPLLDACYDPHTSMKWPYRVINALKLAAGYLCGPGTAVVRHRRERRLLEVVDDAARPLLIAEHAYRRWQELPERQRYAKNIGWWVNLVGDEELPGRLLAVPTLDDVHPPARQETANR